LKQDENDFGFTFEDDVSIAPIENEMLRTALGDLYNLIQPLLTNLKREPDKPTIYWPNRVEKIEAVEQQIENIIKSTQSLGLNT